MTTKGTPGSDEFNLDRVFDLLSHRYRRWLLMYMIAYDKESVPFETAVKLVTTIEPHASADGVRVMLRHNHLRRMERAGIIDYDVDPDVISLRTNRFLETVVEQAIEWDRQFVKQT